jgi:hypothetical protein
MMSDYQEQLEGLVTSLKAYGFKDDQLATLRAKITAELDTSLMGEDLFLEDLEVLIKESINLLGSDAAFALLGECSFAELFQRSRLADYCIGHLLALPSPADFGVSCEAMRAHILEHKDYILKTGLMPKSFPSSSVLNKCFLRFYDTKMTSSPLPADAISLKGKIVTKDPYTFMREVNEFDGETLLNRTRYEPSSFKEAALIPKLKPIHMNSLRNVRPKVVKLALETLALFEDASNKGLSVNDLVAKFGSLVVSNLSREEFVELIKVDDALGQTKAGFESGSDDWLHIDWHLTSSLDGCGLLTNLIELLVYLIELKSVDSLLVDPLNIKAVEALRSVSNTLAGDANYFSAIASRLDRSVLNEFLEEVSELVKGGIQWRGTTIGLLNEVFSVWSSPLPVFLSNSSLVTGDAGVGKNYFGKSKFGSTSTWVAAFDGRNPVLLSNSINFECIKMLLENPDKFIPNGELLAKKTKMGSDFSASNADVAEDYSSSGHDEDLASRKRGSGIDPSSVSLTELNKNKTAYETQLASADLSKIERAEIEEALVTVTKCINRESEYRKNPIFTRERKNLEKTINRGIDEISLSCPKLGQHLKLFMKPVNGSGWSYSPDSKMNWDTHDR